MSIQDEPLIKQLEIANLSKNNLKIALDNLDKNSTEGKSFSDYYKIIENYPTLKKYFEKNLIDINIIYWVEGVGIDMKNILVEYSLITPDKIEINLNQLIFNYFVSNIPELNISEISEFWNPELIFDGFVCNKTIENNKIIIDLNDLKDGNKIILSVQYKNTEPNTTFLVCNNNTSPYIMNFNSSVNNNSIKIYEKTSNTGWNKIFESVLNEGNFQYNYTKSSQQIVYIKIETSDVLELGSSNGKLFSNNTLLDNGGLISIFQGNKHLIFSGCFESNKLLKNVLLNNNSDDIIPINNKNSIGSKSFSKCVKLKYIVIPDRIENITTSCFYDCNNLKIIFSKNCNSIGSDNIEGNFQHCINLEYVEFPSLTNLGSSCFEDCDNLESVYLPKVTHIENHCFSYCISLESINLPECTTIGNDAFKGCDNLESVNLPECTTIGDNAFKVCKSLRNIDLPVCITIGYNAFNGCKSLRNIDLPVCTTINNNTFDNCGNLLSVDLPVCTDIMDHAFDVCISLKNIDLPVCTTIYPYAFDGCTSLKNIDLPLCTIIIDNAFEGCTSLESVNLPECNAICNNVFVGCNIFRIY